MNGLNDSAAAYNRIPEKWSVIRDAAPVNKCIADPESVLKRNSLILDVGCGTGAPIDVFLSARGHAVTGTGISAQMIAIAKGKKSCHSE